MLKVFFLCCFLFLTACSQVNFSGKTPDTSRAEDSGVQTDLPTDPPSQKITVEYPFEFKIVNYPLMYTASTVKVQADDQSCSLVSQTEPTEKGLCDFDPAFSDFCFTTNLRALSLAEDFTCKMLRKADQVKLEKGVCEARSIPLDSADLADLEQGTKYEILSQSLQVDLPQEDIQVGLPPLSQISLNSECECAYDGFQDSRWPALEAHCKKHFEEYR